MALFEIIIELPVGMNIGTLAVAARQAGHDDVKITQSDREMLFSVMIRHPRSSFETGRILAEAILLHLPPLSRYHTHRSSVSINEMSAEDLDSFLNEIENSSYGKSS